MDRLLSVAVLSFCMAILLGSATAPGDSVRYVLDVKASEISWTGSAAVGAYSLTGTLKPASGSFTLDGDYLKNTSLVFDMNTIKHDERDLVKHLKSEDFFFVKSYPTSAFSANESIPFEIGEQTVKGTMNIRGQENLESIAVTLSREGDAIVCKLSAVIDRTNYNVMHASPSIFEEIKENAIADNFNVEAKLVFRNE